jgi:hypothetical protein
VSGPAGRSSTADGTSGAKERQPPGEKVTRVAVTAILALIATLTFAFSFGNIWALGASLGVSPWIAPLVGPAVDLSVAGLLVAIRYLSLRGVPARDLRPARCLLVFTGLATLTLNVAGPVTQGAYGRAAFDAVGPLLMIGWSEVGPGLLRHIHAVRTMPGTGASYRRPEGFAYGPDRVRPGAEGSRQTQSGAARSMPDSRGMRKRHPDRDENNLLTRARQVDAAHRVQHGRPVSAETLRRQLRIGAESARSLVHVIRAEPGRESGTSPGQMSA